MQDSQAFMVVVMEFCDLGSLLRAISKKAFRPHGKWSYATTYVSFCLTAVDPIEDEHHAIFVPAMGMHHPRFLTCFLKASQVFRVSSITRTVIVLPNFGPVSDIFAPTSHSVMDPN